jgi:hypothetical protein
MHAVAAAGSEGPRVSMYSALWRGFIRAQSAVVPVQAAITAEGWMRLRLSVACLQGR